MKIKKITFALAILICLFGITGCNSKEKESGVIVNEMSTEKIDPLETILEGENISITGLLSDATSITLENINSDDLNYKEIDYKKPAGKEIVGVYKISLTNKDEIPVDLTKKTQVTLTIDNLDPTYELYQVKEGFEMTKLDSAISENKLTFETKDLGYFVIFKNNTEQIENTEN